MRRKIVRLLDWESKTEGKIRIVEEGVFVRANHQHLLHKLTRDGRIFFDYICQQMRDDYSIYLNADFKKGYIEHVCRVIGKDAQVTIHALNKYISSFKKLNLIIPNERKGMYTINPRYVRKGSMQKAIKILKSLVLDRREKGLSLKGLIDMPEDKFLKN